MKSNDLIWAVYYEPTAETWYFKSEKLAVKTLEALEKYDESQGYRSRIFIDSLEIQKKVVTEP